MKSNHAFSKQMLRGAAPIRWIGMLCAIVAGTGAMPAWSQAATPTQAVIVALRGGAQIQQRLSLELNRNGNKLGVEQRHKLVEDQAQDNKNRARAIAGKLGIAVDHVYGSAFVGFAARVSPAQLNALRQDPRIESVSADWPMQAQAKPGGGGGTPGPQVVPWGVSRIDAVATSGRGAGVDVFVVDSGIDVDHPDLAANIVDGYAVQSCASSGQMSCHAAWDDDQGHGTHVSGIIAALDNSIGVVGVAPQARLHAVKVLDSRNNTTAAKVAAGLDYVTQRTLALGTATVANVSIGGSGSKSGYCDASGYHGSDNYARAFCEAANAGVVIAVSAGNYSVNARGFLPSTYDDAVVAVSAAWGGPDSPEGDWWWDGSNWGDEVSAWNPRPSAPVALGAPGYAILSTMRLEEGGYGSMTGTSMASPHVAGAMALFLQRYPQPNAYSAFLNIRQRMLDAASSTDAFHNTSGFPHAERYLSVTPVR